MAMLSFQLRDSTLKELERVSVTVGLSKSELCREAILDIIKHYNSTVGNAPEPDCKELLQRLERQINVLTSERK